LDEIVYHPYLEIDAHQGGLGGKYEGDSGGKIGVWEERCEAKRRMEQRRIREEDKRRAGRGAQDDAKIFEASPVRLVSCGLSTSSLPL
jgi:hypothetical protein